MNIPIVILTAALIFLASWTPFTSSQVPIDRIKQEFRRLLKDTVSNNGGHINLKEKDILPIIDTCLQQILPNIHFYYMVIYNGAHYEYNFGSIQTVAAISDNSDVRIRLLLPLDYCESAENFTDIFLNMKFQKHKENTCYAIADLFLKTKRKNIYCCDPGLKSITHSNIWRNDTLIVTTNYKEHCCEGIFKDNNSKMKDVTSTVKTKFIFNQSSLKSIDYSEWKR